MNPCVRHFHVFFRVESRAGSITPAVIKERRLHQQWYQPPVSHGATVRHPPLRIFVKSTDSSRCRLDNDATHSSIDIMVGDCFYTVIRYVRSTLHHFFIDSFKSKLCFNLLILLPVCELKQDNPSNE